MIYIFLLVRGRSKNQYNLQICRYQEELDLIIKQTRRLVSKETVVLRRWGRETQNFGFTN